MSFTILIWDHVVTFQGGLEYVWFEPKGRLAYPFLLNRYLTPIGFMINLFPYFSPLFTVDRCKHFIRYEHCMTTIRITIASIMTLMRINALYPYPWRPADDGGHKLEWYRRHPIVWGVLFLLIVHVSVNVYLVTRQVAVVHNPALGIHSCTGIFEPHLPRAESAASAYLVLIYDTAVFLLLLWKTLSSRHLYNENTRKILTALRREAVAYFWEILLQALLPR